ncbi:hypothetical protein SYNPS1DRAFT_27034 [Syncephalis pseudoplumigaleata]|uniref:Uncharacterized protein n=1 Tax=Syncephalis pseudoplumigaleata TaxID=1712513 RepID=A0A4P9Z483_9FUNG|nr:hypothetical protein SYNPS1DRAFT_27034 [Syncephalis pseudoplumigaleata]|eukprot:RKP27306.1 hypothetical protein SYNPS1DRAFT_27034 [Syncephalis pseudoplumigaleata]
MDYHRPMHHSSMLDVEKSANPSDATARKSRPKLPALKGFLRRKSDPTIVARDDLSPMPATPSEYGRRSWKSWKTKDQHQEVSPADALVSPDSTADMDLLATPRNVPAISLPSPMDAPYSPVTPSSPAVYGTTARLLEDSIVANSTFLKSTSTLATHTSSGKHMPLMEAHQSLMRGSMDDRRGASARMADGDGQRKASSSSSPHRSRSNSIAHPGNPDKLDFFAEPGLANVMTAIGHYLPNEPKNALATRKKKMTKKEKEFSKLIEDAGRTIKLTLSPRRLSLADTKYSPRNVLAPRDDIKQRRPDPEADDCDVADEGPSRRPEQPARHITFADTSGLLPPTRKKSTSKVKSRSPMPRIKQLTIDVPASNVAAADRTVSSPSDAADAKPRQPSPPAYSIRDSGTLQLEGDLLKLNGHEMERSPSSLSSSSLSSSSAAMSSLDGCPSASDGPRSSTPSGARPNSRDEHMAEVSPTLLIMECYDYTTSLSSVNSLATFDSVELH